MAKEKKHIDLQIAKRYVLNPRKEIPTDLLCPFDSDNNGTSNPTGYKCYNNAQEIENDYDADWMHVDKKKLR